MNFIIGFICSSAIGYAAYRKHSLDKSGFAAAVMLGSFTYWFAGLWFSIIMVAFFVSSTILTKFKKSMKININNLNEKNGNRDYMQVIANGGVGLIFAFLFYIYNNPIFMIVYAASFAEANADTWASEIGVLSSKPPFSILTGKTLKRGMSGGVSILGSFFALLGSAFISVIFTIIYFFTFHDFSNIIIYTFLCFLTGFLGSIIDSILGASVQAQFYCEELDTITEKSYFHDKRNKLVKGLPFFNNDMVNLASNTISCLILLGILQLV